MRNSRPLIGVDPVQAPAASWVIRYTFYAFIFSLPFEEAYIAGGTTSLPKLFGIASAAFALLQPRVCYEFPPKAFWWLVIYLFIHGLWALYLILFPPNVPHFLSAAVSSVFRFVQFLGLFWISYNLLKQERIVNGAFWALSAACYSSGGASASGCHERDDRRRKRGVKRRGARDCFRG